MKYHPLCEEFPLKPDVVQELTDDIKQHGQQLPITLYENMILDGRHRFLALQELNIEPEYTKFKGTLAEAREFVIGMNVHRRHMTPKQRAMFAAEKLVGIAPSKPVVSQDGKKLVDQYPPEDDVTMSAEEAAALLEISESEVRRAVAVEEKGIPEVKEAVKNDKLSLNQAAEIVRHQPEEQRQALEKPQRAGSGKGKKILLKDFDAWWAIRQMTVLKVPLTTADIVAIRALAIK